MFENLVVGDESGRIFIAATWCIQRNLLERVPFEAIQNNYNFDAEMIILAHMVGIRTVEVSIPTRYDDEASSLNPIPYGLNVLRMMWRVTTGHYIELLDKHSQQEPR